MRRLIAGLAVLGALTLPAGAQERKDDAFAKAMIDPQLVLRHAQRIGLTAAQRKALVDEIKAAQTDLGGLQANMMVAALDLSELIERPRIDEAAAIGKTDEMLRAENQVKRRQMQLLIRVRNLLDEGQVRLLKALRDGAGRDTLRSEGAG